MRNAVHPLAQAGVELPEPKEPIIANPEGIKGMDSVQQPHALLRLLRLWKRLPDVVFSRGFRVPHDADVNTCSRPPMSPSLRYTAIAAHED